MAKKGRNFYKLNLHHSFNKYEKAVIIMFELMLLKVKMTIDNAYCLLYKKYP